MKNKELRKITLKSLYTNKGLFNDICECSVCLQRRVWDRNRGR